MTTAKIAEKIIRAFPANRPSSVEPLGRLAGIIASRPQAARFADVDSWHDVDPDLLAAPDAGIHAALMAMPSDMWAYYLPAFLTACLAHGTTAFGLFAGAITAVSPDTIKTVRRDGAEILAENVAELTLEQSQAVLAFVKHTMALPDVERLGGPHLAEDAIAFWEERVRILSENPASEPLSD